MNSIMVIYPYRDRGLWVFDDESVGLRQEPFVSGADTLIDRAVEATGVADAESGFRLIFSAGEFPGYDFRFTHVRSGEGGNWYHSEDFSMEGWLCPALLQYFDAPPEQLFTKFESRDT
jgi:hypothetical protein